MLHIKSNVAFSRKFADDSDDLIITGYANTVDKDRAGDVVTAEFWKGDHALMDYRKNPIILAYHQYDNPIGRAIDMISTEKGLQISAVISKGAGNIYELIKDGVLSAFSIGFAIDEAEQSVTDDTYYITKGRILEVSVVTVPCNQESLFSVAKSMEPKDYTTFKNQFNNKESKMEPTYEQLLAQVQKADKAAALEANNKAIAQAGKAAELIKVLEQKLDNQAEAFNVKADKLEESVKSSLAARVAPVAINGNLSTRQKSDIALLATLLHVSPLETALYTKANASSSLTASDFEASFDKDILKSITEKSTLASLFLEMSMESATRSIPVMNSRAPAATWVASTEVIGSSRSAASSGSEQATAVATLELKTFKLAAKAYLTTETAEDTIIDDLDMIRDQLIAGHVRALEASIIAGTGTNQPLGLKGLASAATGKVHATLATHATNAVPVTAAMLMAGRSKLGDYGTDIDDLALIVSTSVYFQLVNDSAFADASQVGSDGTKITGQLARIYGIPVVASSNFAAPSTKEAYAFLVNTKNFVLPRQRELTVKSQEDISFDRTVVVATQRVNFQALHVDEGVVSFTYIT